MTANNTTKQNETNHYYDCVQNRLCDFSVNNGVQMTSGLEERPTINKLYYFRPKIINNDSVQ